LTPAGARFLFVKQRLITEVLPAQLPHPPPDRIPHHKTCQYCRDKTHNRPKAQTCIIICKDPCQPAEEDNEQEGGNQNQDVFDNFWAGAFSLLNLPKMRIMTQTKFVPSKITITLRRFCMREKQGFFNLENKFQDRLRYFMVALAILQILAILLTAKLTNPISTIIGVGLNILILYFSFSTKSAPNLYFQLITWSFWIVVIFNGLEIYWVLSGQEIFSLKSFISFLCISLVIAIAPTLTKYRKVINDSKKTETAS
jgi:hypothetical protein